jgi:hypothetical protein
MATQNIDGTTDGSGVFNTIIPGYDDPADIQAALRLFLYGSTTYVPDPDHYSGNTEAERIAAAKAALPNPSIARYISIIQNEIAAIQALGIGSSYGTEPSNPITGQVWMSSETIAVVPHAAISIYQSTSPTTELHNGLLWVDSSGATPVLKVYDSATTSWKVVG